MSALFIGFMVALTVAIGLLNCWGMGTLWKDVMSHGDRLDRWAVKCAFVHTGIAFSMPMMLLFGFGGVAFLTTGEQPWFTLEEGKQALEDILHLWYFLVIMPIVGTGFVMWLHSVRTAIRHPSILTGLGAGWNTYAQISNTLSMLNNLGGAFTKVVEIFTKGIAEVKDGRAKVFLFVLLVVILSLIGGFTITTMLVRFFARRSESFVERMEREGHLARA